MPMNQEVIPRGRGLLAGILPKQSLQCRDFNWALHMEKSISPLFPGPCGDVVADNWCIIGVRF